MDHPRLIAILLIVASFCAPSIEAKPIMGQTEPQGEAQIVRSKQAKFNLYEGDLESFRLRTQIRLASAPQKVAPAAMLAFGPQGQEFDRIALVRSSGEQDGCFIRFQTMHPDVQTGKWSTLADRRLVYWPIDKGATKILEQDGIAPRSWHDQWITLRIDAGRYDITFWANGLLMDRIVRTSPAQTTRPIVLTLAEGDALDAVKVEAWSDDSRYLPVDLHDLANESLENLSVAPGAADVPFDRPTGPKNVLSLQQACWPDQKHDPQTFYEQYDGGPYFWGDTRMTMLRVPRADYVAAHLLAIADDDPQLTSTITLRAGSYGYIKQVLMRDYTATVPRRAQAGAWAHVVVPMTQAVAQDLLADSMDIELTKELRLARHVPDPNRFRYRPLGPASGVRIAAITLERSPLQMRVTSQEPGHVFVQPASSHFTVELTNITAKPQPFRLVFEAQHLHGGRTRSEQAGQVAPGQTHTVQAPIQPVRLGYHDLTITLHGAGDTVLLRRTTSFAQLGPDTRKHRHESPFGTWEWNGTHVTSKDSDAIGSLYKKMGFRYGMGSHPREARQRWGVESAAEPKLDPELKLFKRMLARDPQMPHRGLIFHETSISGPHVTRVPDLFHDRPPYQLNEEEEKRYQSMLAEALGGGKAAREQYPKMHISFGNGPLPTKEEFYRRKFPAELFDAGGNEAGSFHRLPEEQPPDTVANNASIWMDRQMLDAYGYPDKPVYQCIEVCYPNDNPGNHTPATQADYFARNALHSLAWQMPFLHIGEITDVGNSYYFSNWGAAGFCRAYPEMNVKPAFVAMATLTTVLDGARFVRVHDAGSAAVYALEFARPDGQSVLAFWTIHGSRPLTVAVDGGPWAVIDDQGNSASAPAQLTATPTPVYLVGKGTIRGVKTGVPAYQDAPPADATVIAACDTMKPWTVVADRSPDLEAYNFLTPRRQGDFEFAAVDKFDGRTGMLRITPRPITHGKDTMPMYAQLAHEKGIPMPGQPDEIGIWIRGNSGWGRVIYELQDASGQKWISIGAAAAGEPHPWLLDWMPAQMQEQMGKNQSNDWSTNDPYGYSKINFDGWRYVAFPLPGNYPGEAHPWPANSFWRWDKDGVVHYPLTLTRLIVEIPEKVLHVQTWAPVREQSIYLQNLTVGQRNQDLPRQNRQKPTIPTPSSRS